MLPLNFSRLLFVSLLYLTVSFQSLARAEDKLVNTSQGQVIGKVKDGIAIFKGIPYAKPPIGNLRWHAPVPTGTWSAPIVADRAGSICIQPKDIGKPEAVGTEDCLTANIWAPAHLSTPVPVLVYIHGGFYEVGSSDPKAYGVQIQDGMALAKRGRVVVVSFNYRLGVFGFFASDALNDGSRESQSGNFGLMDQLLALKWIHENIAAFGGDPTRTTVFGESAGASSILTLMASSQSEGLFSQAIVQSGYLKAIPKSDAQALSAKLTQQVNCNKTTAAEVAQCLRNLTGPQVISGFLSSAFEGKKGLFLPSLDHFIVSEPLEDAYRLGHVRKIPVIMGTNADETMSLVGSIYGPPVNSEEELAKLLISSYGMDAWNRAKGVAGGVGSPEERLVQLSTDMIFTCPISGLLQTLAADANRSPDQKVWRYVFSHRLHFLNFAKKGAFHGLDIPYVFGTFPNDFSRSIQDYWLNFAKTGNPNHTHAPEWDSYRPGDEAALEFGEKQDGIHAIHRFRADRCAQLGL